VLDFSRTARSFTSIYQLLPIYPCYDPGDGSLVRVGETTGIPNIDAGRAADALTFHRQIEAAVTVNAGRAGYRDTGYAIHPFVGIAQSTTQAARLSGKAVELVQSYNGKDTSGDGTVPRVSAEPIEHKAGQRSAFFATRHGSLQNADAALANLRGLINSFYLDLGDFRGPREDPPPGVVQIDLRVPDLIGSHQPLHVEARPDDEDLVLEARVTASNGREVAQGRMQPAAHGGFAIEFAPLAAGSYTVHVSSPTHQVEPAEDAVAVAAMEVGPHA
jgi:hypothetical protein